MISSKKSALLLRTHFLIFQSLLFFMRLSAIGRKKMHKTVCRKTGASLIHILVQHPSVRGDSHNLPRDELSAFLKSPFSCHFDASAARNFHSHHGDAFNIVSGDDGCKFLGIVYLVQLRAADQNHPIPNEVVMEIAVGIGGAVSSDKQVGTAEVRCVYRGKLNLYRPGGKTAWYALQR